MDSETYATPREMDRVNVDPIVELQSPDGCAVVGLCDVGKVREENQDYFCHIHKNGGHLLVVSDGMGGHNGGWEASHLVVEACQQALEEWDDALSPMHLLSDCVQLANTKILERASIEPELEGMGATFVGIFVRDGKAWTANLGDSRSYLVRGKEVERLSRDHSRVGMMVEAGLLTEEAARKHPLSNVLEMALGVDDFVAPEMCTKPLDLEQGDRLLLCSDGLWGLLQEEEIRLFGEKEGPKEVCQQGMDLALERGGTDNITILMLDFKREMTSLESVSDPKEPTRNRANLMVWELILAAVILTCVGFTWVALRMQQSY